MQSTTQKQTQHASGLRVFGNGALYGRLLAPAVTRPIALFEVIVGMLLVMAGSYGLNPADPLLLSNGFPWLWLMATIFAIRYGSLLGALAGLCLWAGWLFFYGRDGSADFPVMLFVGGLIQVIVAGHFCDIWAYQRTRLKGENHYLNDRLVTLTNSHFLLRTSHERLEKDLLSAPSSLRDVIMRLRGLPSSSASMGSLPNAQAMLDLAALSCQISDAGVFAILGDGLASRPVASVGIPFELDIDDPLLHECLQKRALSHLRQLGDPDGPDGAYLVCAPIVGATGPLAGVLVVRKMPFLALNLDNLQFLLVLLNYYADGLEHEKLVSPVQESVPHCPYDFALELSRLAHLKRISGVKSSLIGFVCPRGVVGDALFDQVIRERRNLDLLWPFSTDEIQVAILLMPLTDDQGIDAYLSRIKSHLERHLKTDFTQAHVVLHSAEVDAKNPGQGLKDFMSRCAQYE